LKLIANNNLTRTQANNLRTKISKNENVVAKEWLISKLN